MTDRRFHQQQCRHLQQVVLHDVANGAKLLVEPAATLDAERLGHRDLDALDVVAIPDRLEEAVREPEVQRDSAPAPCRGSDRSGKWTTRERTGEAPVELERRGEVAAERFLEHHARAIGASRRRQPADHVGERAGGIAR